MMKNIKKTYVFFQWFKKKLKPKKKFWTINNVSVTTINIQISYRLWSCLDTKTE